MTEITSFVKQFENVEELKIYLKKNEKKKLFVFKCSKLFLVIEFE